jgi:hypothetical protein
MMTIATKTNPGKTKARTTDRSDGAAVARMVEAVSERKLAARRISELTKRATAALGGLEKSRGERAVSAMIGLDRTDITHRDREDLMTSRQVAGMLGIDIDTVKLWSMLGVLKNSPPPVDGDRFRWADVVTFLPAPSGRHTAGEAAGPADRRKYCGGFEGGC